MELTHFRHQQIEGETATVTKFARVGRHEIGERVEHGGTIYVVTNLQIDHDGTRCDVEIEHCVSELPEISIRATPILPSPVTQ